MTLARSLTRQGGVAGALAVIGGVTAVLVAVISAVQMALDGVALKATIDTWTNASQAADKASAYQVAVECGSAPCSARGASPIHRDAASHSEVPAEVGTNHARHGARCPRCDGTYASALDQSSAIGSVLR